MWIRILVRLLNNEKLNFKFYMKNIFQVGDQPESITTKVQKPVVKGNKPGLIVNFGQFPFSWIRIRIPNTDPDPGQPNLCGSMRIRIRIHNTDEKSPFATERYAFINIFLSLFAVTTQREGVHSVQ
jgi:hypothetical protein